MVWSMKGYIWMQKEIQAESGMEVNRITYGSKQESGWKWDCVRINHNPNTYLCSSQIL